MQTNSQPGTEIRSGEPGGGAALLGRLMWMIFGPMVAVLLAYAIVTGDGWLTPMDAAFALVVVLMVGGRWVEQRSGAAMTAMGKPATWEHYKRYVRILFAVAAGVWLIANVLGNHVLT